jgi:MFS family permease
LGLVDDHQHTWPKPLQPLEHREFRLLWTATLISNAGSWMQRVATGWLIYSLSGSTVWLGLDAFAAGIPTILLLPIGGVLADRMDRRKMLVTANLVNATLALLLAVGWWIGALHVWHILGSLFLAASFRPWWCPRINQCFLSSPAKITCLVRWH